MFVLRDHLDCQGFCATGRNGGCFNTRNAERPSGRYLAAAGTKVSGQAAIGNPTRRPWFRVSLSGYHKPLWTSHQGLLSSFRHGWGNMLLHPCKPPPHGPQSNLRLQISVHSKLVSITTIKYVQRNASNGWLINHCTIASFCSAPVRLRVVDCLTTHAVLTNEANSFELLC